MRNAGYRGLIVIPGIDYANDVTRGSRTNPVTR